MKKNKEAVRVHILRLTDTSTVPEKKSKGAAAYDIFSDEMAVIDPGRTVPIKTGICLEIPEGWKGEIYSRSSVASRGLMIPNSPGKIDSDYRGEIKVLLHNLNKVPMVVKGGDRIAQIEINRTTEVDFITTTCLSKTTRGGDGFGSTGK